MWSIMIIFIFISCLFNLVNAEENVGGYIGGSIGGLVSLYKINKEKIY